MHGSSGTGGRPTLVGYTRADLRAVGADVRPGAGRGGRGARQRSSTTRTGTACSPAASASTRARSSWAPPWSRCPAGMTARQVTLLRDLQPDILTCTPSYAIRLGEALAGGPAGAGCSLKAGVFGAEPWTEALRAADRGPARHQGAATSTGCPRSSGPASPPSASRRRTGCTSTRTTSWSRRWTRHRQAGTDDGMPGELTFTTVTKEALPLLRYRTGDIAALRRGAVRLRADPGPDEQGHRPAGRHARDPRRERLPERGRAGAARPDPASPPHYLLVVDERGAPLRLIACCEYRTQLPGHSPAPASSRPGCARSSASV